MVLPANVPNPNQDPQPVLQPNLAFHNEQEDIITELFSLAWQEKRNAPDWLRMRFILEQEEERARRIEFNVQRDLLVERFEALQRQHNQQVRQQENQPAREVVPPHPQQD